MLSTSFAFRRYVANGGHLATRVALTFADGTEQTIYGDALAMGGISFSSATSSSGSFDIGAAVVGSAELTLANFDERWDDADFTGATCVVSVGAELDGGTEWLRKGEYGIEQPESYDSTIALSLRDNMRLFERDYSDVGTVYPATLQTIVTDICQACGVTMRSASFPRDSYVVGRRPDDEHTSCLDVLAWAMQVACCWARMDPWGRLECRWYDTAAFETEDWLDGGSFSTSTIPYSDGDAADGGGFHYGGSDANGGSFSQIPWATITAIKTLSTSTDDVVITGVEVTASAQAKEDGTQGAAGETHLYGSDGYKLRIEGNPLVEYGKAQQVANVLGPVVVGMRFRPLAVSSLGDPAIEAGDPMLVVDRKGRTYRSWVTSTTWKHGGFQNLACDAETPARNKADTYSAQTRSIVQQRNAAHAETTAREQAIADLAEQLSESSGLYMTRQQQQDQSYIYYMHDKPTLAESQIVWKLTANAFGISTDGGMTYPYGLDVTGNAILNRIYTIGLNASYINAGTLSADRISTGTIRSADGRSYWNLSDGTMKLYAKNTNAEFGKVKTISGDDVVMSLIKLDDGMYYSDRYGQAFSVTVDATTSRGQATSGGQWYDYKNSYLYLTNTYGNAGVKLYTGGTLMKPTAYLEADGPLYIDGGYDSLNSKNRVVVNNGSSGAETAIYGTTRATVTPWSDRRLKRHVAYLGEDAIEFVRRLRPVMFDFVTGAPTTGRHLGFYAQDVQEAEPEAWESDIVTKATDDALGYSPLALEYTSLIAPLVAYAQHLEERVNQQQKTIDRLAARINVDDI